MWRFVLRQNIINWRQLLSSNVDNEKRSTLERLIVEAESDLAALESAPLRLLLDQKPHVQSLTQNAVDDAIGLSNAQFGSLQLFDGHTETLIIVAQRNFRQPFLDHFANVEADDGSACGRALANGRRTIIEDIVSDGGFRPHLEVALEAGYRSVQSTPLFNRAGAAIGMLSTHYADPRTISDTVLSALDSFAYRVGAQLGEHLR